MVLVNYLADVRIVPAWLKHASDTGLTFVDVIAPAFLFAIGLTYRVSMERRLARDGRAATIGHFVRRWFAIMGIGALISAGEGLTGVSVRAVDWGVLQAIGVAGLLTLPLLRRSGWFRLLAGGLLLAIYQVGFMLFFADHVLISSHGGLWGSLAWTATLVFSTCFGDLLHQSGRRAVLRRDAGPVIAAVAFLAVGLLLSLAVPISKPRVSASYVLVTVGISGLVFWALFVVGERIGARVSALVWWGRNPMLLYVLHYFLLALIVLPGVDWWHDGASTVLVSLQSVGLIGILTLVAWLLHRRSLVASL